MSSTVQAANRCVNPQFLPPSAEEEDVEGLASWMNPSPAKLLAQIFGAR